MSKLALYSILLANKHTRSKVSKSVSVLAKSNWLYSFSYSADLCSIIYESAFCFQLMSQIANSLYRWHANTAMLFSQNSITTVSFDALWKWMLHNMWSCFSCSNFHDQSEKMQNKSYLLSKCTCCCCDNVCQSAFPVFHDSLSTTHLAGQSVWKWVWNAL